MIEFENCLRCGSEEIDKVKVNTCIRLTYPERRLLGGGATQRVIEPTDALVCKSCGHIELFIDWDK